MSVLIVEDPASLEAVEDHMQQDVYEGQIEIRTIPEQTHEYIDLRSRQVQLAPRTCTLPSSFAMFSYAQAFIALWYFVYS
jgi:hypothetical protein